MTTIDTGALGNADFVGIQTLLSYYPKQSPDAQHPDVFSLLAKVQHDYEYFESTHNPDDMQVSIRALEKSLIQLPPAFDQVFKRYKLRLETALALDQDTI